jgi:hypothetical protein
MPQKKNDQDKADEQGATAPDVNATPRAMPATKFEGHRDPAKVAIDARIRGAYQLGGVWYTADGSTITNPKDVQAAHRAADKAAAEARRRALLGGGDL